jgi:phage baseplate assembly protein W
MAKELPSSLKKTTYKDFDIFFRKHPVTGKLIIKKDDEAVKQAVRNLVLTNKYERPFSPEFGGDVSSQLFENFSAFTESDMETQINTAIKNFEPRVKLSDNLGVQTVTVLPYPDYNGLNVTVRFKVIASLSDVSLDINLNRVR